MSVEVHRNGRKHGVNRIAVSAPQPVALQPVFVLQVSDTGLDCGTAFHPAPERPRRALVRIGEQASAQWLKPRLLAAVGRLTRHAGKTRLHRSPLHGCRALLMLLIANIRAAITHVRRVAEQSPGINRWKTLLDYIVARILPRTTTTRLLANPT